MTVKQIVDLFINDADVFTVESEGYNGRIYHIDKTDIYTFIEGYENMEVIRFYYSPRKDYRLAEIIYKFDENRYV